MCYDVSYLTKKAENYAKRYGTKEDWEDLKLRLPPTYHVSGFVEPQLPAITAEHAGAIALDWPFIPVAFAPKAKDGRPINTLNARDDKIFQKQSFYYEAARERRCIVMLDGFFDHRHQNGIAFPHYVHFKNGEPLVIAGLWQEFQHRDITRIGCTLVTTQANKEMAWIHNEPAYSPDSRMVAVLPDKETIEQWLYGNADEAQTAIRPLLDGVLTYHPCRPLKSNKKLNRIYPGNVAEVQEITSYSELNEIQGSLF